jgi:hypothetical protein
MEEFQTEIDWEVKHDLMDEIYGQMAFLEEEERAFRHEDIRSMDYNSLKTYRDYLNTIIAMHRSDAAKKEYKRSLDTFLANCIMLFLKWKPKTTE